MKYLLYAAILGFGCWLFSEILEIVTQGYTPLVYYLTSVYHVLAGIGIWGLHKTQTSGKNIFNLLGVVLASSMYIAVAAMPIQVMNSGLSFPDYIDGHLLYKMAGTLWTLGMILFSISIIRSGFFPIWSGIIMLVGILFFVATPIVGWPVVIVNVTNILVALTVIYMSLLGLKPLKLQ